MAYDENEIVVTDPHVYQVGLSDAAPIRVRVPGEAFDRVQIGPAGVKVGDGSVPPATLGGGGGGGAPIDARYVTLAAAAGLSDEELFSRLSGTGDQAARDAQALGVEHDGALWLRTESPGPWFDRWNGAAWVQATRGLSDFAGPQDVGTSYVEFDAMAAPPANPAAGSRRVFVDQATGKVSARTSGGATVSLEEAGANGWEVLGATKLAAPANTSALVNVAARDVLKILVLVAGYDATDIPGLRFNGDGGANYNFRCLTAAAAGAALVNQFQASQTLLRLTGTSLSRQRAWEVLVGNFAGANKSASLTGLTISGGAATEPPLDVAPVGGWFNNVDQITSVRLVTVGANNLLAGSGIVVLGRNLS